MASALAMAHANLYNVLSSELDVQVTYGVPDPYEENEVVAIRGFRSSEEDAAIGAQRREENFWITLTIKVWRTGGDSKHIADRTFAIYDEVRAAVHADRTLNGAVRLAGVGNANSLEGIQPAAAGGRIMFLDCEVDCRARITGGNT